MEYLIFISISCSLLFSKDILYKINSKNNQQANIISTIGAQQPQSNNNQNETLADYYIEKSLFIDFISSSIKIKGTGFVVWAVWGEPSGFIIVSQLPWSAINNIE